MLESGSEGILQRVRVMKFVDFWCQNLTNFHKIQCLKQDRRQKSGPTVIPLPDHSFHNLLCTTALDGLCGAPIPALEGLCGVYSFFKQFAPFHSKVK